MLTIQDWGEFPGCMLGPNGEVLPTGCDVFDFDGNGHIDLIDARRFQILLAVDG